MNFNDNFPKSQKMLNEIINGYFRVWCGVSMLRESINNAKTIQSSNTQLVCSGVKFLQETLYYSSVVEVRAWFIGKNPHEASLHNVMLKLKNEYFSNKLEDWYCKTPSTIYTGSSEETSFWQESFTANEKAKFQSIKKDILEKYDEFINSVEVRRVGDIRNKYVAHKDFKKSELYNPVKLGHQFSDVIIILERLDEFIFDLNRLFNKSTYSEYPSSFDKVSEQFWRALKSS